MYPTIGRISTPFKTELLGWKDKCGSQLSETIKIDRLCEDSPRIRLDLVFIWFDHDNQGTIWSRKLKLEWTWFFSDNRFDFQQKCAFYTVSDPEALISDSGRMAALTAGQAPVPPEGPGPQVADLLSNEWNDVYEELTRFRRHMWLDGSSKISDRRDMVTHF